MHRWILSKTDIGCHHSERRTRRDTDLSGNVRNTGYTREGNTGFYDPDADCGRDTYNMEFVAVRLAFHLVRKRNDNPNERCSAGYAKGYGWGV
jgi:hypothetical protein